MRVPVPSLIALALTASAAAQSQAELVKARDGKLQLPFLKQVDWTRDFDEAKQRATKTGRWIFAYFTRSDERCQESILLECGPFAEPGFKTFGAKVVPFCHITTRVAADKHQELHRKMGFSTWPRIVFLDAKGEIKYYVDSDNVADFEKGLAELERVRALEKQVAGGDRKAALPLLQKQLELYYISYPDAKKALRKLPRLSGAQKAEIAPLLLEAEVLHLARQTGPKLKDRAKTGKKFLAMKKQGHIPARKGMEPFWRHILAYAQQFKKPELYEEALDILKQHFSHMEFKAEDRILRDLKESD